MEFNLEMKYCLVTVGTTEFRDLIKNIQNQKFINLLINLGIEKLYVQYGTGTVCYFRQRKVLIINLTLLSSHQILMMIAGLNLTSFHIAMGM